jgi:flagellar operon protein
MERLNAAVNKAESKGAKESLILMDQLAFIVNVPDRKVVTTINMNQRSEGVFTQIDSVVIAPTELTA